MTDFFGTVRRKGSRAEFREAYRLWYAHADIRTGRALTEVGPAYLPDPGKAQAPSRSLGPASVSA